MIFGQAVKYNSQDRIFKFKSGATLEIAQVEAPRDYDKFQGRDYTFIVVDEAQQYSSPELLDRLRSNLRGPVDVPTRFVVLANPGGVGHHWLTRRYIQGRTPWQPFHETDSEEQFVACPSILEDNPFIDPRDYEKQLKAACANDAELYKAWRSGNWFISRGAFFSSVLDEQRSMIEPWPQLMTAELAYMKTGLMPSKAKAFYSHEWEFYLGHDWGSSAPSVTYLVGRAPGGKGPDDKFYPKGSIVLIDEVATHLPNDLSKGTQETVPQVARKIIRMCERWKVEAKGVADSAIFSQHGYSTGSIADEFARAGVEFNPVRKGDRKSGWEALRTLMQNAGHVDIAGLYVSRACTYFWATVPSCARDERKTEDLDTDSIDHAADAGRYAVLYRKRKLVQVRLGGL